MISIKSFKKSDIEARFKNSNIKYSAELEILKKPVIFSNLKFNRRLTIVIPGSPIVDERTRFTMAGDGFFGYNPAKNNLKKIFEHIYDDSDMLNRLVILSPMTIELKVFKVLQKNHAKILTKSDIKLVKDEKFLSFSKPDNDNIEKVHFDVIQDDAYNVILRDENIVSNTTTKYHVFEKADERVEMTILYIDSPTYLKEFVYDSVEYFKYTISLKHKLINNISDEAFAKEFYKNILLFYKKTKKKDIMKPVLRALSYYDTKSLRLLATGNNKDEIISNIVKTVEKLIGGLTK